MAYDSPATPMVTTEDIADVTLHHMGRTGVQPFVVVIGAMDGVTFDEFHGYIAMYEWTGLYVEPIPEQFRRLRAHYATLSFAANNKYENSAIADHDGTVQMLTIDHEAVDAGEIHHAFGGMSAIYPPRNGLASAGDAEVVARYGRLIEVDCLTLPSLFRRHAIDRVDLLCVDAEGWDYRIIQQLDFSTYRPKLIRCEYINLTADERSAITRLLTDNSYVIRIDGQNIDAVASEYWAEVNSEPRTAPVAAASPGHAHKLTLVTAVFDLSSGAADLRLRHAFGLYLDDLKRLLNVSWQMVIFAQPELEEMLRRHRAPANTHIVTRSLADLEAFPFQAQVQEIRGRDVHERARGPGKELERGLPLYYAFALSKQFFLNDAAIFNPFDSDGFLWVDGGIAAEIGDPAAQLTDICQRNLSAMLADHRMLYFCRPLGAESDSPGFSRANLTELTAREPAHLVHGGVFGGTRRVVNAINGVYYSHLGHSLNAGCLGTEEHVLTMVAHTHAPLCRLQMLSGDGGLRQFFERLQHGVPRQGDRQA
ncbi:MAG: FkbM family methyltransferase [Candidatus Binatia bacterium]